MKNEHSAYLERFGDYISDKSFGTVERYKMAVEKMLEFFGDIDPPEITKKELQRYNSYLKNVYSTNSRLVYLSAINHFMQMIYEDTLDNLETELKKGEIDKETYIMKKLNILQQVHIRG